MNVYSVSLPLYDKGAGIALGPPAGGITQDKYQGRVVPEAPCGPANELGYQATASVGQDDIGALKPLGDFIR